MGGGITCESTLGSGTTFTITISIGDIAGPELIYESNEIAELTANEQVIHQRYNNYKGRVLLAEDTEENQHLISLHLRKSGIDATIVGNGKEAVDAALESEFDLVLMDLQMPVLNGLDAIRVLRKANYNKPIVALTANTSLSDKETCKEAGTDDFISKPINFESFYAILDIYLKKNDKPKQKEVQSRASSMHDSAEVDDEYQQILKTFLDRLPQMVDTIKKAVKKGDWETVQSVSHQLKGLGGSFGYEQITATAKSIHDRSRKHSDEGMDKLLEELNHELDMVLNTVQDQRKVI
jgi:CheY-like chemotaxis protein